MGMAKQSDPVLTQPDAAVRRRGLLLGTAVAALAPAAEAAAQRPAPGPPAAPRGTCTLGFSQEFTVAHPLMPANEIDQAVWWNLFSPLWGLDPTGGFYPILAKAVPSQANGGISADGLEWRVELREGVRWHDGRPFSAEDVKFSLQLIMSPNFRARGKDGYDRIESITTDGPNVIRWRLRQPYAPLMSILSIFFIVPAHLLSGAEDPNNTPFHAAPVGTGAFKWGERRTGSHVTLTANPDFFGQGPYLERLVFRYVPDVNVMYTQFRTGALDYIGLLGIPANHYGEARTLRDRVIHVCPRGSVENLTLNLAHPVLGQKLVRQALYLSLNTKAITEALYYGLPKEAVTFLPPENWAYNDALPKHEYDPARAARMLDDAGWRPGPDGIRVKDGLRLEFTNSTTTGTEIRTQAQQLLAQEWLKIGISMKIHNLPAAVLWGKFWAESQFDSLMTNTTYTIASDPNVLHRFGSHAIPKRAGSGSNVSQFENARADELLARGVVVNGLEERRAIYREVQDILREELPMLPIFQGAQIEGTKAGLMGFENNVHVLANSWNAARWYWA
jgi:peptide/nickel transport system substrate-binding protein